MSSCKIFSGKSLGKSAFGELRKRLEHNVMVDLKEISSDDRRNIEKLRIMFSIVFVISIVELSGAAAFVLVLSFGYLFFQ